MNKERGVRVLHSPVQQQRKQCSSTRIQGQCPPHPSIGFLNPSCNRRNGRRHAFQVEVGTSLAGQSSFRLARFQQRTRRHAVTAEGGARKTRGRGERSFRVRGLLEHATPCMRCGQGRERARRRPATATRQGAARGGLTRSALRHAATSSGMQ